MCSKCPKQTQVSKWILIIVAFLILDLFFASQAQAITLDPQRIENTIQQKLPNTPVGIFVQDAKTGKILFERRAQETFLPASTMKVITAASSLFILGPQYQYETAFKSAANAVQAGVLTGNLYLVFSGDPSLHTEDLQKLVEDLKTAGIKQIKGNLVIDDSLFEGKQHPYGWMADDLNWYFAAPISTVIIDENRVKLRVKSNKTLGEKATIVLSPETILPIKITQQVVSVTETEAEDNCELNVTMDPENNINIKGCWPAKEKDDELKVAVKNPNAAAMQLLKKTLKSANISLTGKVVVGIAPKELQTLALHRSAPLETLLKNVLQDSNNLYSESLVKAMAFKKFQQGTFQAGLRAMKDTLNSKFAIDTTAMRIMDGSGDSRYDAVTPEQLGRVLYVMYHDPEVGKLFQDTLPSSGNTGTLKQRMEAFDLNGVVRAKTGSMTGVSALAGYISNQQKDDLVFVIMINGAVGKSAPAKQLENELCKLFIQS
jgi:D-alanyl-D-alanine carboxypeptidase/D-alanyl-D-alanine-endopeptidase (penicillin-binding protein 4)